MLAIAPVFFFGRFFFLSMAARICAEARFTLSRVSSSSSRSPMLLSSPPLGSCAA
jgi:hypothetical protein